MNNLRPLVLSAVIIAFTSSANAAAITNAEEQQCRNEYHTYCSEYGLDSPALRTCMNKNGKHLSNGCLEALIDAGEVTRAEVERRRKSGR
jgi:hypothetical protein